MVLRMTTQTTRTTDTLAAAPADFAEMSYSSALLLPAHFDVSITSHPEYAKACADGFDNYFGTMYEWNDTRDDLIFVNHFYSHSEMMYLVAENMVTHLGSRHPNPSLVSRVGVVLGWLSALALTDRPLALAGLELVHVLADHLVAKRTA